MDGMDGAGLHGRCRWRLPILFFGILFATGRRTAASWLRAAGVSHDFQDYYYFISAVGRKANILATRLLLLLLKRLPSGTTFSLPSTTRLPSVTARKSRGQAYITIPLPDRPTPSFFMGIFGSPWLGWHDIRSGVRLACPCERRSMSGGKTFPACPRNWAGSSKRNSSKARRWRFGLDDRCRGGKTLWLVADGPMPSGLSSSPCDCWAWWS